MPRQVVRRRRNSTVIAPSGNKRTTVLRGTIVNRTYGTHKNRYISLFLLTIVGIINYGPPQQSIRPGGQFAETVFGPNYQSAPF